MSYTCSMHHRHRAFSILELVVVLGVIALIAGAGLSAATGAIKAADRVTTQERLNTIKLALDSYAKTYGYLPCPADRTLQATATNFGIERRSGNACTAIATGAVLNANVWIGGLPVRTLGLPDHYAWDAWSGKLTYAASASLISTPTAYSTQSGTIIMHSGNRTLANIVSSARLTITGGTASNNGGLRVSFVSPHGISTSAIAHIASPNYKGSFTPTAVTATTVDFGAAVPFTAADTGISITWQTPGAGAAYAVVSHGPDGRGAFAANGAAIPAGKPCSTTTIDGENCNDDASFFDSAYNDGTQAALYFDDYIVYGSNEAQRIPVNPTVYTNSTVSTCPAGSCEAWCAGCTVNYPGGGTLAPPSVITSGATLCRKLITSNATTCTASCFWSGITTFGFTRCS